MADINIENIVVSTQIADSLDVDKLSENIPDSKYNPDEFPGLILRFKEPKTAALIFSSGKVICTGAKNMDEANNTINNLIAKIKGLGISVNNKPEVRIQNVVASSDFKKDLQLKLLAEALMSDDVEYEPEQFPGLVYRMDNLGVVLLIFSSGKLVCTGAEKIEDVNNAIDAIEDKLKSLGVL